MLLSFLFHLPFSSTWYGYWNGGPHLHSAAGSTQSDSTLAWKHDAHWSDFCKSEQVLNSINAIFAFWGFLLSHSYCRTWFTRVSINPFAKLNESLLILSRVVQTQCENVTVCNREKLWTKRHPHNGYENKHLLMKPLSFTFLNSGPCTLHPRTTCFVTQSSTLVMALESTRVLWCPNCTRH